MAKDQRLIKVFNEYVKKVKAHHPSKSKTPKIKPSMLGTACDRKLFYSRNRVPETNKPEVKNQRIMLLGDYIEDMICASYRDAGILIDYRNEDGSTPIRFGKPNPQFPINAPVLDIKDGYMDAVVVLDGELWLVDLKSIKDRGYTEDIRDHAKPSHYVQVMTYFYAFNKLLREGAFKHIQELDNFTEAAGFKILYYNKDNSYSREFTYKAHDGDFKKIIAKVQNIRVHSESRTLPPATPEYCSTCGYRSLCEKDELGF